MRTAVVFVALLGSRAFAQVEQKESAKTEAMLKEGRALDEAGDYSGACAKFSQAIAAAPNSVNTMLGLGSCHEHLRKYATALMWFRRARVFSRDHGFITLEERARGRAESLEAHVPVIKISFARSRPPGVKVAIDDYPVPPQDYKRVELDPGQHTLDVIAPGFEPFHQEIDIEDGAKRTIVVALVATDGKVIPGGGPDDDKGPPMAARKKTALVLMVGGGVALASGAGIGIYARGKYNQCVVDGTALPTCLDGQNGYAAANHYRSLARWAATPLFLGGAALIGVGVYMFATTPDAQSRDVAWTPIVGADQLGISAFGRF